MNQSEYSLSPCNHKEFDTRVILHAANAASQGYKCILIIANDTDVVVQAISFFNKIGAEKLWVTFGKGKKIRYTSIHDICSAMSPAKTRALPGFHTLTGCDHTSFFLEQERNRHISSGPQDQNSQLHCAA